jgi:hypothetical protein
LSNRITSNGWIANRRSVAAKFVTLAADSKWVKGVAGGRQNLRTVLGPNPTGVLAESDVANAMEVVFDRPMVPIQLQQPLGAGKDGVEMQNLVSGDR